MEFAQTVHEQSSRTDDSWQPYGSRSFFVCRASTATREALAEQMRH